MTADEAIAQIGRTDSIGFGLITATPTALFQALSRRTDWEHLTICGGLSLGDHAVFMHPNVHYKCHFMGGADRAYKANGANVEFMPSFFRHYGLMMPRLGIRNMMLMGSMPDEHGNISASLYNGATLSECLEAGRDPNRLLIVECSPHYPRTRALEGHMNTINLKDVDIVVYSDSKPPVLANPEPSAEEVSIAKYASAFIKDGATLQTGIGAVPNAVALTLLEGDGGDYGIHSEMFTDGLMALMKSGKATNARKSINKGKSVITFAAGSDEMYEFLHENDDIGVAQVFYTNDPHVINQNSNMVCINSAMEVDLLGQMAAESVGLKQFSGVGGHQDFIEGTSLSLEHVSLVCLLSTTTVNGQLKSRISSTMTENSAITSPRQLAGVIVTEYGAADLRAKSVRERAELLASIAHPDFRDELLATAKTMG
jgi:acyl-CoA hydrolase